LYCEREIILNLFTILKSGMLFSRGGRGMEGTGLRGEVFIQKNRRGLLGGAGVIGGFSYGGVGLSKCGIRKLG
jgi:hypothetical protein